MPNRPADPESELAMLRIEIADLDELAQLLPRVGARQTPEDRILVLECRKRSRAILERLEVLQAWDRSISLAYEERTGHEREPHGEYTDADFQRSKEILELFF